MNNQQGFNVVLIGMPGVGKSTVGVILAKYIRYSFVDTDLLIQTTHNKTLQRILDVSGYMVLREIEERVICSTDYRNHVIATGGSAVYSHRSMEHLGRTGTIVFLSLDFETLRGRIDNYNERGIARRGDQTFEDLYNERNPLYEAYADLTISCHGKSQETISHEIKKRLAEV